MDDSPARKLATLLEQASPEDRQAITTWLLDRPVERHPPAEQGSDWRVWFSPTSREPMSVFERVERVRGALLPGEESQLVTLRLSQEQHARLRQWCNEHSFSMAAVIRGLVERFLAAQQGEREE